MEFVKICMLNYLCNLCNVVIKDALFQIFSLFIQKKIDIFIKYIAEKLHAHIYTNGLLYFNV